MSNSKPKKTRVAKIEGAEGLVLIINELKYTDRTKSYELFVDGGTLPNGEEREEFFSINEAMAYAAEIVDLAHNEFLDSDDFE